MESKSDGVLREEARLKGRLELREDRDGFHHYLDGRRVERGAMLELLLGDGNWLRGEYDWKGIPVVWPALRIELAGPVRGLADRKNTTALPIPPSALLRWVRPRTPQMLRTAGL